MTAPISIVNKHTNWLENIRTKLEQIQNKHGTTFSFICSKLCFHFYYKVRKARNSMKYNLRNRQNKTVRIEKYDQQPKTVGNEITVS
jgi:hypothetical protein